ncbi:PilW family protein [Pelosinus sp. UFO1]|uniref:PilW family protein n=1 Tax=Pelosinus sp. UFO1 TaxID=484770 RepID=UPI0004D0D5FC|nr:prepilin-type N-terminal cleavage/methylation domain-containing protein [Pelosinus sp. UFO1]AIF51327.1 hypothetical protein UFO1_1776 [Pelosinus sp. UFO1]
MNFKNNKGYTLIGLIIGMAIFSIIASGMLELFIASNRIYQNTIHQAEVIPIINTTLSLISEELKFSTITNLSGNKKKIDYTYNVYENIGAQMKLTEEPRCIYFDDSTKKIVFTRNAVVANIINSQNIQNVSFEQVGTTKNYIVRILFNSSGKDDDITITSNIMTGGI